MHLAIDLIETRVRGKFLFEWFEWFEFLLEPFEFLFERFEFLFEWFEFVFEYQIRICRGPPRELPEE